LGLQNLLAIVFLSEKDNITPLRRNIFGIVLNAFLNYFFGIRLHMNAAGFAIGTAISWTVLCLWLYVSWARRHQIQTLRIIKALWKSTAAAVLMLVLQHVNYPENVKGGILMDGYLKQYVGKKIVVYLSLWSMLFHVGVSGLVSDCRMAGLSLREKTGLSILTLVKYIVLEL